MPIIIKYQFTCVNSANNSNKIIIKKSVKGCLHAHSIHVEYYLYGFFKWTLESNKKEKNKLVYMTFSCQTIHISKQDKEHMTFYSYYKSGNNVYALTAFDYSEKFIGMKELAVSCASVGGSLNFCFIPSFRPFQYINERRKIHKLIRDIHRLERRSSWYCSIFYNFSQRHKHLISLFVDYFWYWDYLENIFTINRKNADGVLCGWFLWNIIKQLLLLIKFSQHIFFIHNVR